MQAMKKRTNGCWCGVENVIIPRPLNRQTTVKVTSMLPRVALE
jgi:hypothetical protein